MCSSWSCLRGPLTRDPLSAEGVLRTSWAPTGLRPHPSARPLGTGGGSFLLAGPTRPEGARQLCETFPRARSLPAMLPGARAWGSPTWAGRKPSCLWGGRQGGRLSRRRQVPSCYFHPFRRAGPNRPGDRSPCAREEGLDCSTSQVFCE